MFNISGLDHINIEVKSLSAAKDFYQKYFGMQVIKEYTYPSSVDGHLIKFMLIGIPKKMMFCFYENEEANLSNIPLSHIGIHVENFNEALNLAIKDRILDERWGIKDYEISRSFYITDPNGLEIEISEAFAGGH